MEAGCSEPPASRRNGECNANAKSPSRFGSRYAVMSISRRLRHVSHVFLRYGQLAGCHPQAAIEISNDVARVFNTHREANQLRSHASVVLFGFGKLLVSRRSGVNYEGLG